MTIITLTTDFGGADGYVGTMKGVILGFAPAVRLVDLSHEIAPQDIRQAIHVLRQAAPYFPPGTIHLAVVDPGVGSARQPLLVTTPQATFVGPDNGLFTFALEQPGAQAYVLDRPEAWLPQVSRTFHGRDIFAPVAARLALGMAPGDLGTPISNAVRLAQAAPQRIGNDHVVGSVVHVDRFGNLISDVPAAWLEDGAWVCQIADREIAALASTYAEVAPGIVLGLVSSGGTLEVAVREGSAARDLGVGVGATLTLRRIQWRNSLSKAAIP